MKVLFLLPDELEALLAAISTVQDYVRFYTKTKEEPVDVHVICETPAMLPFIPALGTVLIADKNAVVRSSYDLLFEFDTELAYKMSLPTQRHMVASFGLQLGIDPPTLPDLSLIESYIKEAFPQLYQGNVIVERRSGLSYLACAVGRPVVEIYPTDRHRRWLSKWSHKYYSMVYADNPSAEIISRAVEAMKCRAGLTTSHESKTQTEPQTSTAASAGA